MSRSPIVHCHFMLHFYERMMMMMMMMMMMKIGLHLPKLS